MKCQGSSWFQNLFHEPIDRTVSASHDPTGRRARRRWRTCGRAAPFLRPAIGGALPSGSSRPSALRHRNEARRGHWFPAGRRSSRSGKTARFGRRWLDVGALRSAAAPDPRRSPLRPLGCSGYPDAEKCGEGLWRGSRGLSEGISRGLGSERRASSAFETLQGSVSKAERVGRHGVQIEAERADSSAFRGHLPKKESVLPSQPIGTGKRVKLACRPGKTSLVNASAPLEGPLIEIGGGAGPPGESALLWSGSELQSTAASRACGSPPTADIAGSGCRRRTGLEEGASFPATLGRNLQDFMRDERRSARSHAQNPKGKPMGNPMVPRNPEVKSEVSLEVGQ